MPGSGQAGPTCGHNNPVNVNDGTLCRAQSPPPGSVGFDPLDSLYSASHFLGEEFEGIKAHLSSSVDGVERTLRSDYEGAKCIYEAYQLALGLVPEAILKETGYEISSLLAGLIPGLLQMVVIVGATTFLGAAIGGIVGFFFGGAGAIPGVAVGADIGMDLGVAFLTWLGVGFLLVSIAKGFVEMLEALRNGIEWAWAARTLPQAAQAKQISAAAFELARTVGILVRLILQGIVAYLLKKAAVGATRSALATGKALQVDGAAAVSDDIVAELIGKLRVSKFGGRFADWVEDNWPDMVKNLRLRGTESLKQSLGTGSGGGGAGEGAAEQIPIRPKRLEAADGQLRNKEWSKIEVKPLHPKPPEGPVDYGNLSGERASVYEALHKQGRSDKQITQVMESGSNFGSYTFNKGDKLFRFDSAERAAMNPNPDSPYWLDESGYNDVKAKFEHDGKWDRQGVKDYLALPCNNKADVILQGVVTKTNEGVVSTINPATENVSYTAANGKIVQQSLSMQGGGTQVTPTPGTVSIVGGQ